MKRDRTSKHVRSGSSQAAATPGRARHRRLWILALLTACASLAAASGWFFSWDSPGLHAHRDGSAVKSPPAAGEPPVDAPTVLGVPAHLPQTTEQFNEELLAIGRCLVKSLPNETEAQCQMALIYSEIGRIQEVLESWKQALALNEAYPAAYLGIAAVYAEQGENDQAIVALRRALELEGESEETYQLLAEVLLREGKAEEARETAQECVRRFPSNYENHFWLGQAWLQLEKYAEAQRCHEEAVRLNPEWTQSYYSLSVACARLGDREKANRYRERFAALKSADQKADRDQVKAYNDLSARREALVKRHILAGAIQLRADHVRMTEAHWLRACEIEPDEVPTREALVLLYERQGRADAAVQMLEALIQLKPDNAKYPLQKGRWLSQMERWDDARNALEKVLKLTPDSVEANLRLAQIHLRTGKDLAAALACAEKAVSLEPSTGGLQLLAAIRGQIGDYAGARAALKQAVSIDPYDQELRRAYGQLLKME